MSCPYRHTRPPSHPSKRQVRRRYSRLARCGSRPIHSPRAARLAPRDPAIRRALQLLPPPDPVTEQMLHVGWATPAEWGFIAATGWVILWLTLALGGRRRAVIALFGAVAIGASLLGAIEW